MILAEASPLLKRSVFGQVRSLAGTNCSHRERERKRLSLPARLVKTHGVLMTIGLPNQPWPIRQRTQSATCPTGSGKVLLGRSLRWASIPKRSLYEPMSTGAVDMLQSECCGLDVYDQA